MREHLIFFKVKMAYIWKCEACPWEVEGTAQAYGKEALKHYKQAKSQGEKHSIRLVNKETGEIPLDDKGSPIRSPSVAQSLGLIPGQTGRKPKTPGALKTPGTGAPEPPGAPEPKASSAMKGKITPIEVPLDARLYFLYEWDRSMVPQYQGNFSQWLFDSVMGFHIQNKDAFKLDLLVQEVSA